MSRIYPRRQIEDFHHLIIDVRFNQGGSYIPWMKNIILPLAKKEMSGHFYLAYRKGKYVQLFKEHSELTKPVSKEVFSELPPEVKTEDYEIYEFFWTAVPPNKVIVNEEIIEVEQIEEIKFKGEISLFVGTPTFSATDALALFCKETGFATLYGTHTGGDGISCSPIFVVLPNSKLVIKFTPAMGIDYLGQSNEEVKVEPNVYYDSKLEDENELINHVINQIELKNQ